MVLYINACVREESRTKRLADYLIKKIGDMVDEIKLSEITFPKVDEAFLIRRDGFIRDQDYSDKIFDFAKVFSKADTIVIAAPFWDLSFPSVLKQYFEQICVLGVTFSYSEEGIPQGLCLAKKLYYVTTAGGNIFSDEYGFGYLKALAQGFYGIPEVIFISAEGLDIIGADVEKILYEAEQKIDSNFNCDHKGN